MKVLHSWLKDYLGDDAPTAEVMGDLLTFHAFEIDGLDKVGEDTLIDISILPNRASDCLCHRGIAREIATLVNRPLTVDPFLVRPEMPLTEKIKIEIEKQEACRHFDLALMSDIKIAPSPEWLQTRLKALGQRSINNVVDATNYVMLSLGQPLHAYDAGKFKPDGDTYHFKIRLGKTGETVTTLSGDEYQVDESIQLITNGFDGALAGIAGIKGGKYAEVDQTTTSIILEAGNFEPGLTRKASQKLKLQTDASKRFENGVSSEIVAYALAECVKLITEIAGGKCEGYAHEHPVVIKNQPVSVTLTHINALLGLSLEMKDVTKVLDRLGFLTTVSGEEVTTTAPFERTDIIIPEDVIEEVGRVYGYQHVASVVPETVPLLEINKRHFYSEKIRSVLLDLGFSEVITSSFRNTDAIRLQNALASDKGCLRSSLRPNLEEVLSKNITLIDLLGIKAVKVFEIGTVFEKTTDSVTEHSSLAIAVQQKQTGHTPKDDEILKLVIADMEKSLGVSLPSAVVKGVSEINLTNLLQSLPEPEGYEPVAVAKEKKYLPFSNYPFIVRDIAMWVSEGTASEKVSQLLQSHAGPLCVRLSKFDEFTKDGKTSFGFRLIFQSYEKTLTDEEINVIMNDIYQAVAKEGWEVR